MNITKKLKIQLFVLLIQNQLQLSRIGNVCIKADDHLQSFIQCYHKSIKIQNKRFAKEGTQFLEIGKEKICFRQNEHVFCENLYGQKQYYFNNVMYENPMNKIIILDNSICTQNKSNIACFGDNDIMMDCPIDVNYKKEIYIVNIVSTDINSCLVYQVNPNNLNHFISCWGSTSSKINNVPIDNLILEHESESLISMGINTVCQFNSNIQFTGLCWGECPGSLCVIPTQSGVVTDAAVGSSHACLIATALNQSADLTCWGSNEQGQISIPDEFKQRVLFLSVNNYTTCIMKTNQKVECFGGQNELFEERFSMNWFVELGGRHTCVIKAGSYKCWGNNEQGQTDLGPDARFEDMPFILSAGWDFSCFINIHFNIDCKGFNYLGQTDVPYFDKKGLKNINIVEIIDSALNHSCVLLICHENSIECFKCWGGQNEYNELEIPIDIKQEQIEFFTLGHDFNCLLIETETTINKISCQGNNDQSQLLSHQSEQQIFGLSAGGAHGCYLMVTDQTKNISCWGSDSQGQISIPESTEYLSAISLSDAHTCGVDNQSFKVTCWGLVEFNLPEIDMDVNFISTAYDNICVLNWDKSIRCQGDNEYGQCYEP